MGSAKQHFRPCDRRPVLGRCGCIRRGEIGGGGICWACCFGVARAAGFSLYLAEPSICDGAPRTLAAGNEDTSVGLGADIVKRHNQVTLPHELGDLGRCKRPSPGSGGHLLRVPTMVLVHCTPAFVDRGDGPQL